LWLSFFACGAIVNEVDCSSDRPLAHGATLAPGRIGL
jgi:hypothetical protein